MENTYTQHKNTSRIINYFSQISYLFRVRKRGKYELADIANMDQTGSSFVTDDGKTYETTNSKDAWFKLGQSSLAK